MSVKNDFDLLSFLVFCDNRMFLNVHQHRNVAVASGPLAKMFDDD